MKRTYRNAKYLAALLAPLFLATAATLARADEPRPDILIADFEGNDYGDWTATGDAFGESPATDEYLGGTGATFNVSGRKLVNTLANPKGDGATGTLTSSASGAEKSPTRRGSSCASTARKSFRKRAFTTSRGKGTKVWRAASGTSPSIAGARRKS